WQSRKRDPFGVTTPRIRAHVSQRLGYITAHLGPLWPVRVNQSQLLPPGQLGQDLFYPPNVGGWKGGRTWLSTQGIIGRANYPAALAEGRLWASRAPLDVLAVAKRHGRGRHLDDLLSFAAELLTGAPLGAAWHKRLRAALGHKAELGPETARASIALIA